MKSAELSENALSEASAELTSKRVKREARLRSILDESAFSFFGGTSKLAFILRLVGIGLIFALWYFEKASPILCILVLFGLGGYAEAIRANRRLDAYMQLMEMERERDKS